MKRSLVGSSWRRIGTLDAIPCRGARIVETDRGPVAVFRTGDDQVFALDDRCPRSGGPLSCGIVHGHQVTCPLHATEVCLETGEAIGQRVGRVLQHAVQVTEDREVYLAVSNEVPRPRAPS